MILKFQQSLNYRTLLLVYNEDRSIQFQEAYDEDAIDSIMGGKYKVYLDCDVDEEGNIVINKEAPEQEW